MHTEYAQQCPDNFRHHFDTTDCWCYQLLAVKKCMSKFTSALIKTIACFGTIGPVVVLLFSLWTYWQFVIVVLDICCLFFLFILPDALPDSSVELVKMQLPPGIWFATISQTTTTTLCRLRM